MFHILVVEDDKALNQSVRSLKSARSLKAT